jgi:signal-transduction protein with cAMP-binding, CBS, and nucleotidyltransferase domain
MKTGISVCEAMTTEPVMLEASESLKKCAEVMAKKKVGAIIIRKGHQVEGIISEQDIVRRCLAKGINPLTKKISDFMSTKMTTIDPKKDLFDALILMKEKNVRHLPVVEGKKIVGLLTLKDILKIEPQLFDLIVEKIELREEDKKPIFKHGEKEDICQECGELSEDMKEMDGVFLCKKCLKESKK